MLRRFSLVLVLVLAGCSRGKISLSPRNSTELTPCAETPAVTLTRIAPDANVPITTDTDVSWRVEARSRCSTRFVANDRDATGLRSQTFDTGGTIITRRYSAGTQVSQSFEVYALDSRGNPSGQAHVSSPPFTVSVNSGLSCSISVTQPAPAPSDGQGTVAAGSAIGIFVVKGKRASAAVPVLIVSAGPESPDPRLSLLDPMPSVTPAAEHSVRISSTSVGAFLIFFRVQDPITQTSASCSAPLIVSGFVLGPLQVSLRVRPITIPPAEFGAGPLTVPYNSAVELAWSSANATTCSVPHVAGTEVSGVRPTPNLVIVGLNRFMMNCSNPVANASVYVDVIVASPPPLVPTANIRAKRHPSSDAPTDGPVYIDYQGQASLSWSSENVSRCEVKRGSGTLLSTALAESGLVTSVPEANEIFVLTCFNSLGDLVISDTVEVRPENDHLIFITSQTFSGDLGGLSGADSKCAAAGLNLRPGRPWRAILSSTEANALSRITLRGPVYNPSPTQSTRRVDLLTQNGFPTFFSSFNQENPTVPFLLNNVIYTELGTEAMGFTNVWVGSNSDGRVESSQVNGLGTCINWHSANRFISGTGVGSNTQTNREWLDGCGPEACSSENSSVRSQLCSKLLHLYCVSQ